MSGDHIHALQVLDDGDLLLGLHGALYRSQDRGDTWSPAGLEGQDAMSIAAAGDDELVFVAGHEVLQRSQDGGETFDALDPPDLPSLDIHAFAQSASQPEVVYAFVVGHGIYVSSDAGETWKLRSTPGQAFGNDIFALLVDPDEAETVLAGGGQSGLLRSTDGGQSFQPVLDQGVASLTADPDDPGRLVALTTRGIEASDDGGQQWTAVSQPDVPGRPVAVALGDEGELWLVTDEPRTLQRSDDGGASWRAVPDEG